jgi:cephalosporin hydroxylase/glycosyltransferase involved in cell wall biosynthesis
LEQVSEPLKTELRELAESYGYAWPKHEELKDEVRSATIEEVIELNVQTHNHFTNSFMGVPIQQSWADLAVWEKVLARLKPKLVIELGTHQGGLATFFKLQSLRYKYDFYTFDRKRKTGLDAPLAKELGLEEHFREVDLFDLDTIETIGNLIESNLGLTLLLCDNGNKPKEFEVYAPLMQDGDYIVVHDWGAEIAAGHTKPIEDEGYLHREFWPECEEVRTMLRFWRVEQIPEPICNQPVVKAVITSLNNLPLLEEQLRVLEREPCISHIIVVNNGSSDGTAEWLDVALTEWDNDDTQLTVVHRENFGAGPGRNAGLNAAGEFDYVLMLDGGIRPLIGGTQKLLDFLERRDDVDVLGVEIPHFETDEKKAWRRWPNDIGDEHTYHNTRLSHTAYCLCRAKVWDGMRFSEEGPFAEPGWGADDDEMAYQWLEKGITVHAVTNIHPYRRASGSFGELYRETGIWPNQYGSVYEERVVWLQQQYPHRGAGVQWGEPWLTLVIEADGFEPTVRKIKKAHDLLRERKFEEPWEKNWNPYHIMVHYPEPDEQFAVYKELHALRQHHGNVTVNGNGTVIQRTGELEELWTGDFIVIEDEDWESHLRRMCHYYAYVPADQGVERIIEKYNQVYPVQPANTPPEAFREKI